MMSMLALVIIRPLQIAKRALNHNHESVAGAATDDTSHVLLRGAVTLNTSHKSESFVISQPLGFSPIQT